MNDQDESSKEKEKIESCILACKWQGVGFLQAALIGSVGWGARVGGKGGIITGSSEGMLAYQESFHIYWTMTCLIKSVFEG